MAYENDGRRIVQLKWTGKHAEILRTPDHCFENLPGYDFEPNYVELDGLRMHYVDEGPAKADPVLLMHGEPTWSYLYRNMIPPIVAAGHRVIAPDMIGFGKSDKPAKRRHHSYQMHVDLMTAFIKKLDLKNITLFCQDWGGLIGLRVAAENEERYARVVAANTALPGRPSKMTRQDQPPLGRMLSMLFKGGGAFLLWLAASQLVPKFSAGYFVQFATVTDLPDNEAAAYDAPFPSPKYQAAPRVFPTMVMDALEENSRAWNIWVKWEKPFLTAFSDKDPILGDGDIMFQNLVPGAKGQPHVKIKNGHHFLQEDASEQLSQIIIDFIGRTSKKGT